MSFLSSRLSLTLTLSMTGCAASAPTASAPTASAPAASALTASAPPVQTIALAPEPARPTAPRPAPTSLESEDAVSLCDRADERVKAVGATLRQARRLDPTRPEAYYNEALWLEQLALSQRCDPKIAIPILEQSDRLLTRFIELAGNDPTMAGPVADARGRIAARNESMYGLPHAVDDLP